MRTVNLIRNVLFTVNVLLVNGLSADNLITYDGHIHYDEDIWTSLSPEQATQILQKHNIQRALVSATPTEGAEKLYLADPETIVPMLRPYKSWRHRYFWFKDPELKNYLELHLSRIPYRGFGEFHIFGQDADSKPVEDMIELARQHKLVLHPHTDLEAMQVFLRKAPDISIIWAHAGFDVPVNMLQKLMDKYPLFYVELSLREAMLEDGELLTDQWKTFLIKYRERFLVGSDTYKPSRWADMPEIVADTHDWLRQLPEDVAADIARHNFNRLFPKRID